jgi:hypothetical protein
MRMAIIFFTMISILKIFSETKTIDHSRFKTIQRS